MMKKTLLYTLVLISIGIFASGENSEKIVFQSGNSEVTLIELFTSQGCSSTPRAEKYFNYLVSRKDLWKKFIPVSFHVDYWNSLGWKDPYSSLRYTNRQKEYRSAGIIPNLYTPGVMVNGKPWSGWYKKQNIPYSNRKTGLLTGELKSGKMKVKFDGKIQNYLLHVAILGFDINTDIKSGENRDRKYRQDFVVLKHNVYHGVNNSWIVNIPKVKRREAKQFAIALWISGDKNPVPVQAAGGWIEEHHLR